jgi:hypothetical protein
MPKRWRVVRSGSWRWEYYEKKTGEVFESSATTWEKRKDAKDAVYEMKAADVDEEEGEAEANQA